MPRDCKKIESALVSKFYPHVIGAPLRSPSVSGEPAAFSSSRNCIDYQGAATPPIVDVITAARLLRISRDTRFVPTATPLSACAGFAGWSFNFEKDSAPPPFDRLPDLFGKARLSARLAVRLLASCKSVAVACAFATAAWVVNVSIGRPTNLFALF